MSEKLTIQRAVEKFDLYDLYNDIIDSYSEDLEDPSVTDLYELLDEYEEPFIFHVDEKGNVADSFEKNLREAIATIIESEEELSFVDDEFEDDEIPEIYGDEFETDNERFNMNFDEDKDRYED